MNETVWKPIAPQVIAAAATEGQARDHKRLVKDQFRNVNEAFQAAKSRGEIAEDLDVQPSDRNDHCGPVFPKVFAGLPFDQQRLENHVGLICQLANAQSIVKRR